MSLLVLGTFFHPTLARKTIFLYLYAITKAGENVDDVH
jgi:hypothetical protein